MDFAFPADQRAKIKERERVNKYLNLEDDGDTNCHWYPQNSSQRPDKETGGTRDKRKNWNHWDHSTMEIG